MTQNTKKITGLLLALLLVLADQATKLLAAAGLKGKNDVILIPGVLQFHYLENQSAAFSMDPVSIFQKIFKLSYFEQNPEAFLQAKMIFFAVLTIAFIAVIIWLYFRIPETKHFLPMNVIAIFFMAGAAGNLIDRMVNNYVIDFIYFSLINFPVFNVADIYVTVSAFAIAIFGIFFYKEEDFQVFSHDKK